jgi:hypothetical protein
VTQLYDDVNDLDDAWYAGRLDPLSDKGSEDQAESGGRPGAVRSELAHLDGADPEAQVQDHVPGGEPLFEQLREAYLRGDDSGEWVRQIGSEGWEADSSGEWDVDSSGEWESDDHAGWDEAEDELEDELEELDEDDEVDTESFGTRARGARRGRRTHGRVALRRTSTLLNASTVMITAVGVLAAMALTGLILSSRILTMRQMFFLAHSSFGIVIVHAFGGGLGTLLTTGDSRMKDRIRKLSTAALAVVAWLASATGTWFGYAGYRAQVPPGGDIGLYPREYLLSSPDLAFWETFAMEWKVHIG